jgi:hypothetical protein
VNGALADRLDRLDRLVQQGKLTRPGGRHPEARQGGRRRVPVRRMGAVRPAGGRPDERAALGQVAGRDRQAKGKSVGGLESALIAPVKARLDAAVKAGRLTKSQERHVLGMVTRGTDDFVTHGFRFKMRLHHDWHGGGSSQPTAFGL